LHELHVPGISVTNVKGYGEYANFFTSDWTVVHARVEIFLPRRRATDVARAIADAARTGEPGDGIVVVLPVDSLYHIRSGEIFASAEFRQPDRQVPGPMPAPTAEAHHG
jgi:nitrogen regulatory protein P-II 1